MTTKHVVADDVLGRISRKVWELIRRVLEGSVDPKRSAEIVQLALEGVPEPRDEGSSWGTYVLELHWAWDNGHQEFVTIGIEKFDHPIPFERIIDSSAKQEDRDQLLRELKEASRSIGLSAPMGSPRMIRLYRVVRVDYFGWDPSLSFGTRLGREGAVDLHFILNPICDFDDDDKPIHCRIEKD
ncbi:MAG: hypothetical protein WC528_03715 [Patescibacteria group bacterium]